MQRSTVKNKILSFLLTLLSSLCYSQQNATLKVGDNAPLLKIEKWLKGEPIVELKKGEVYLVELGTRFCHGCLLSIPHLSNIAEKFAGKIKVISVLVDENDEKKPDEDYITKLEVFVKAMDAKIKYSVAADVREKIMYETWTRAAGFNGYPLLFIVNQEGKIAYIGTPLFNGLESFITQILNREFDINTAGAPQEKMDAIMANIERLGQSGYFQKTIEIFDSLIAANPFNTEMITRKFEMLLLHDEELAYKYANDQINNPVFEKEPIELRRMASRIAFAGGYKKINHPNWALALQLNDKAFAIQMNLAPSYAYNAFETQAYIYGHMNNFKKAAQAEQKAIEYYLQYNNADLEKRKQLLDNLSEYLKKIPNDHG
jgi:thiol-disulfide isomerase/thioredoxin